MGVNTSRKYRIRWYESDYPNRVKISYRKARNSRAAVTKLISQSVVTKERILQVFVESTNELIEKELWE